MGCGEHLPKDVVRYSCSLKPKPCSYCLCESCFHLGPGEGGLLKTASFLSQQSWEYFELRRCCHRARCCCRRVPAWSPPPSAYAAPTSAARMPTVTEEPDGETPAEAAQAPPRVAAGNRDFGLPPDAAAQARWADFAAGAATRDDAEGRLLRAAQRCAEHLRFLKLSVKGEEELLEEQQSDCKDRCLELYSPLAKVPTGSKEEFIEAARALPQASRAMGALVGMAVGDSLGAPFEFIDAVDEVGDGQSMFDLEQFEDIQPRNRFRVKRGQWTDDTSMGLCLADTLLARGCYDGSDVRVRFHNWWFRGYNNAFGNDDRIGSVGLGGNVAESLRVMVPNEDPPPRYEAQSENAGNGTLMRLAPVPVFLSRDPEAAAKCSAESSYSTHPGATAAAAAAFLGYVVARAISREKDGLLARDFLDSVVEEFVALGSPGAEGCDEVSRLLRAAEPEGGTEECWNWRSGKLRVQASLLARGPVYNGFPCYPDYFGSYCIDGLAVALWSFYHTQSFMEAVARSANFLGDADTMAAICGQLAGAFYGYDAIDQRCIDAMNLWDDRDIACRGALLHASRN